MNNVKDGVSDPMTPEEPKAQVIAAARDVVKTLQLKDAGATFRYEACSDEGKPPYRGLVQIDYAHSPTYEGSQAEVQRFGSTRCGAAAGAPTAVSRATQRRWPRTMSSPCCDLMRRTAAGSIEVRGECRDATDHRGNQDIVDTSLPPDALS